MVLRKSDSGPESYKFGMYVLHPDIYSTKFDAEAPSSSDHLNPFKGKGP
jgi:hypothetical protein